MGNIWSSLEGLLLCNRNITLMAESEEELKNLLMKVKEECGLKYFLKAGVKLNIKKPKILASGPITS